MHSRTTLPHVFIFITVAYYDEIDINEIDQAFVPAIEIASESTLGITVYNRKSYAKDWEVISVGSCVIY